MIPRNQIIQKLETSIKRSPITALLGPRQCGKTTLARQLSKTHGATFFDLESQPDLLRLQNPEFVFKSIQGLVILDEIQIKPDLFSVLRVVVDKPENRARFLILGSASPNIIRNASETLAGRVEFIELSGFNLSEVGFDSYKDLWMRGGFPRSYLAASTEDSTAWQEGFIRTFLERDIPQLGITIPAQALRRFWTMLAHFHGQIWNASKLARSMGVTDKTARSYLDLLTGTFIIRQLQPWYENLSKRQVKSPKIYFRDPGLLHRLLELSTFHNLLGHPKVGASWEGFALEQVLQVMQPGTSYFWASHSEAEIDLFLMHLGKRFGFEFKLTEAPKITKSVHVAMNDLRLDHHFIIYPGDVLYAASEKITVMPIVDIHRLKDPQSFLL